ncbi:peptidase [Ahniella affigens]|uniref:Peptidase n=1 Tax=Ahniella affigens TaxID=2021234 RepID=A0A2P1PWH0_9GAMM|nr:M48 family metallopeptidase [Ahniella affigens]AVP99198.1 peptidase [Ahniella affigens]
MKARLFGLVLLAGLGGCATNMSGRDQLLLISDSQINTMGLTAFQQMKASDTLSQDAEKTRYVDCITQALVRQLPASWQQTPWEVAVFNHKAANAFALPGGKVGVHTGMFPMAETPDQMAAVLAHEIAHVVDRHGAARVSNQFAAEAASAAVAAYAGRKASPEQSRQVLALLGVGSQVGVLLPFSRQNESDADLLGQRLMAQAGFDPSAAVTLWQRMTAEAPVRSPEWLSTHPDPERRADRLTENLGRTRPLFEQARARGASPQCRAPKLKMDAG